MRDLMNIVESLDKRTLLQNKLRDWLSNNTPNCYIDFMYGDDPYELEVDSLWVDPKARGTGEASKAMTKLCQLADIYGITLSLSPSPTDEDDENPQLDTDDLRAFYKNHGFEWNYGDGMPMVRKPSLHEAPIPMDWDASVFTPTNSYRNRINYAVERALKLGKGSSRSAFLINIDGKESVLKVAHNAKGLAQNAAEASILSDNHIKQLNITIPMIDYDTENQEPLWINVERALKAHPITLRDALKCGASLFTLIDYAIGLSNGSRIEYYEELVLNIYGEDGLKTFKDYAARLAELHNSGDILLSDLNRVTNWGFYKNKPVVIDVGFTSSVLPIYQKRNRRIKSP